MCCEDTEAYYTLKESGNIIHVFLSKALEDPHHYEDLLWMLHTAEAHQEVVFHLNCCGGRVDTGVQIVNAIENCAAKTSAIVESEACSMATYIFLAVDERYIQDNCLMMFHNIVTGYDYAKLGQIKSDIDMTSRRRNSLSDKYYKGFLTDGEIKSISNDVDIWLDTKQIRKRLKTK